MLTISVVCLQTRKVFICFTQFILISVSLIAIMDSCNCESVIVEKCLFSSNGWPLATDDPNGFPRELGDAPGALLQDPGNVLQSKGGQGLEQGHACPIAPDPPCGSWRSCRF